MRRAVVIGASVAGSLCAQVLSARADEVVVVERDGAIEAAEVRPSVPQGRHVHALWYSGLSAMGEIHPGLLDELVAAGATPGDVGHDFGWWQLGRRRAPVRTGWRGAAMTRPLLEATLRRRAFARPNVRHVAGRVEGLTVTNGAVDGVLVAPAGEDGRDRIPADLVVDCSGRRSQLGAWLAAVGYVPPTAVEVRMDMGYASRFYRREPGAALSDGTMGLAALAALPAEPRACVAVAVEGDRWLLGVSSYGTDRPTASEAEFVRRCAATRVDPLAELLAGSEPASDVATHRLSSSLRRDYDTLARFPAGLLVAGDAVASFNPVYAQGMTCAAFHAVVLRDHLDGGDPSAAWYFRRIRKVTDRAWSVAVTEDFRLPATAGPRPVAAGVSHRVGDLYARASLTSAAAHRRFLRVAAMERPPTDLVRPDAWPPLVAAAAGTVVRARAAARTPRGAPPGTRC